MEDIQLTALVPQDMAYAQSNLIDWCGKKAKSIEIEADEIQQAINKAVTNRWQVKTLRRVLSSLQKRKQYYDKIKIALEHGYVIVPNFPIQLFAIRTDAKKVNSKASPSYWGTKLQDCKELPDGLGEYKNPFPIVERYKGDGSNDPYSMAVDWDELEFPITMAKPDIIEATDRSMAIKIFDQLGIMPATKNEDPVIIAQIVNGKKRVSFMIAWHLNTKDL